MEENKIGEIDREERQIRRHERREGSDVQLADFAQASVRRGRVCVSLAPQDAIAASDRLHVQASSPSTVHAALPGEFLLLASGRPSSDPLSGDRFPLRGRSSCRELW